MSGGAGARTAAVVVAYESGPALARCAADLADAGVAELVVVDNGSADGSVAAAAAGAPGLMPVTPGRNLGYGSAANRGVAATTAPYVLVCNPDLEVPPDALDALAAALDADPARAVAGPLVRTPGGDRYPSARHFPSLVDAAGHAVLAETILGRGGHLHRQADAGEFAARGHLRDRLRRLAGVGGDEEFDAIEGFADDEGFVECGAGFAFVGQLGDDGRGWLPFDGLEGDEASQSQGANAEERAHGGIT